MRKVRAGCALALAAAGFAVLPGMSAATGIQTATATFEDPAGDVTSGKPDITTVTVGDLQDGTVTIDATVSGDLAAAVPLLCSVVALAPNLTFAPPVAVMPMPIWPTPPLSVAAIWSCFSGSIV